MANGNRRASEIPSYLWWSIFSTAIIKTRVLTFEVSDMSLAIVCQTWFSDVKKSIFNIGLHEHKTSKFAGIFGSVRLIWKTAVCKSHNVGTIFNFFYWTVESFRGPTLKIVYSRYSKTPIYRGIWGRENPR